MGLPSRGLSRTALVRGFYEGQAPTPTTVWLIRPGAVASAVDGPADDGTPRAPDREVLASIVDSSQDAIWTKRLDGTITSWNKAAERMLGYRPAEILGRPVGLLFPRERLSEEADIVARVSRGERVEPFETVRVRKDGTPIDVSVTISPLRDAQGTIVGASQVARDITAQKRVAREE
ncbi:MAG: hypothetical protein QOI63_878, partial [Thermoplasmata archaeon]|nr:hypothetical protein [Thermoplasmata archaeon]